MAKNSLTLKRSLLVKDYEGYKLSLASLPVHQVLLENGVSFAEPSDDQYNYVFQLEYSTQNYLVGDPWSSDSVYFIDDAGRVRGNCPNDRGELDDCKDVYRLTSMTKEPRVGQFAPTLRFSSEKNAVLTDGLGSIHLVDTGPRSEFASWKLLHSDKPLGDSTFKILDSRYCDDAKQFHVLVSSVERMPSENDKGGSSTVIGTVVAWLVYTLEDLSEWTRSSEEIKCKGEIDYAAVEPTGQAVYIASAHAPESTLPYIEDDGESTETLLGGENVEASSSYDYHWQQSYDDIKLWLRVPDGTSPSDVRVDIKLTSISVSLRGTQLLSGKTFHCVEPELTSWSIKNDQLEMIFHKTEEGAMWQEFITSDKKGKEIPDDEVVADIHSRLAHLCSETEEKGNPVVLNGEASEECDACDKDRTMYRFVRSVRTSQHKVSLGNHQWLFNITLSPDAVLAFCMRNDVDGCVWQPTTPESGSTDWFIEHEGTLLAFGYVQASKSNRKFTVVPQDMSYAAIVESTGRVILLRKAVAVTSSLRNRKSGKTFQKIGMQNLINLHTSDIPLGAAAFNDKFYVLTKNALFLIHVDESSSLIKN